MSEAAQVPIDSIAPHPRNVREGDVGAICESLKAFGQYRPIVVQASTPDGEERNLVIAGNHTWRAAKALGWDTMWAVRLVVDDAAALRIMVADNRTHDLGTDREGELFDLLTELAAGDLLEGTGWDGDDLDRMLTAKDWNDAIDLKPSVTKDGMDTSGVGFAIGPYRWEMGRDEYEAWIGEITATTGGERGAVIAEMRRRLGT